MLAYYFMIVLILPCITCTYNWKQMQVVYLTLVLLLTYRCQTVEVSLPPHHPGCSPQFMEQADAQQLLTVLILLFTYQVSVC